MDAEGYILVDKGVRLRYFVVGKGSQNVIIPGACGLMGDLAPPLIRGRRLIFYDMRGRGASDTDPDETRLWSDYEMS